MLRRADDARQFQDQVALFRAVKVGNVPLRSDVDVSDPGMSYNSQNNVLNRPAGSAHSELEAFCDPQQCEA